MFYKIPTFSDYEINENGVIRTVKEKRELNWHWSNGYNFIKIFNDFGKKISIGKHRALALTFIEIPESDKKLEVNHINGIRSDNRLENLEWVTRSQNTKHAYDNNLLKYTPPRKDRYVAKNIYTNQVLIGESLRNLGSVIEVCPKVLTRHIYKRSYEFPIRGYEIKILEKGVKPTWHEWTKEELEAFKDKKFIHWPVWVDDNKGFKKLFGSVPDAANFTNVHERQVREFCKNGKTHVSGFNFIRHRKHKT